MFKLDALNSQPPTNQVYCTKGSLEKKKRGLTVAVNLANQTQDDPKGEVSNRRQIDVISSGSKTQQNTDKGSAAKGIQVMSSRQGSHEKRPLLTSRSRQRQKESRQIKSQSHVSRFMAQPGNQMKDASIDDQSISKNEYEELCLAFQLKMKDAIVKSQVVYRREAEELRDVINENEQRINNLICTLNMMIAKNDSKEKMISKLEEKLQSLTKYHEQCYDYSIHRCRDIQAVFKVIIDQMESKGLGKNGIEQKVAHVDQIIKNVFLVQRQKLYEKDEKNVKQVRLMSQMVDGVDKKMTYWEKMYGTSDKLKQKQSSLMTYLAEVKQQFKNSSQRGSTSEHKLEDLTTLLKSLNTRISDLQLLKQSSRKILKKNEERAQSTIWQLSNLLHNHERQLEKRTQELQKRENELQTTNLYNKQIENKLIQSRIKENNLKTEMQSFYKSLETSNIGDVDEIQKERDCFKEKFEEMFRHSQYLEEVNCRNKIQIMGYQKQIEKDIEDYAKLKKQMEVKQQYWQNKVKLQILSLDSTMRALKQQNASKQQTIVQNAKQVLRLQMQLKILGEGNSEMQAKCSQIMHQYEVVKKQFDQEQLYSEDLQVQNEKLTTSLNEYKAIFLNQSSMFKDTINKLKEENTELHKNLELQSDKIFANQPKKYEPQHHRSPSTFSSDTYRSRKSQEMEERQTVS